MGCVLFLVYELPCISQNTSNEHSPLTAESRSYLIEKRKAVLHQPPSFNWEKKMVILIGSPSSSLSAPRMKHSDISLVRCVSCVSWRFADGNTASNCRLSHTFTAFSSWATDSPLGHRSFPFPERLLTQHSGIHMHYCFYPSWLFCSRSCLQAT